MLLFEKKNISKLFAAESVVVQIEIVAFAMQTLSLVWVFKGLTLR